MGRKSSVVIKESQEELNKWLLETRYSKMHVRVSVLISFKNKQFKTNELLSEYYDTTVSTVQRWLKIYKESGIAVLCKKETRKKPSKLITPEIHEWLNEVLHDSSAPVKGYKHLQILIEEKFNVQIKYHSLYFYVKKYFRTKLKSPRKSHIKKDPEAQEAFLKTA